MGNTLAGYFFLKESYAPVILVARKISLEKSSSAGEGKRYHIAGQDTRSLRKRLAHNMQRPLRILFTQPMVLTLAIYQAILFGTTYSLWTNFEDIYGAPGYGFSTTQVGLMYLGPGLGFLITVWFLVPKIDTIYNKLTERNNGKSKPEYRLPLSNIGAILVPISLFWFAWTVEYHVHWFVSILATVFFGLGIITIINSVQNYFIDSFSQYAASAIAAGTVFRSVVGGVMPLVASGLFKGVGYGWGISAFAFAALALAPAPLIFIRFGARVRERYAIEL